MIDRFVLQAKAQSITYKRVMTGELARLDGSILCVDCGEPATCYDHRDYNKPEIVEPICTSCNKTRPPAKPSPEFALSAATSDDGGQEEGAGFCGHCLVEIDEEIIDARLESINFGLCEDVITAFDEMAKLRTLKRIRR